MLFRDHVEQLITRFQSCEWHMAEAMVWQAALLVYAEHPWSFCVAEGRIDTEAAYTTGKVKLVQGSTAVVAVGDAVFNPAWWMRRFTGEGRHEEYDITITGAGTATLGQKWLGESLDEAAYAIFRDTYPVPADCDYGREFFILDPARDCLLRFKDLGVFILEKARRLSSGIGYPQWVTRVGIDSNGVPLLRFGPEAPVSAEGYPIIYFRKPAKPSSPSSPITPLIPAQFEDMIWRRARWLYSEEKGKRLAERNDLRRIYWGRHFEAVKVCDGGAEVERRIATQYPAMFNDFAAFTLSVTED